jgi:hypothetical protein
MWPTSARPLGEADRASGRPSAWGCLASGSPPRRGRSTCGRPASGYSASDSEPRPGCRRIPGVPDRWRARSSTSTTSRFIWGGVRLRRRAAEREGRASGGTSPWIRIWRTASGGASARAAASCASSSWLDHPVPAMPVGWSSHTSMGRAGRGTNRRRTRSPPCRLGSNSRRRTRTGGVSFGMGRWVEVREGTRATRDCPGSFPGGPRGPRMTP